MGLWGFSVLSCPCLSSPPQHRMVWRLSEDIQVPSHLLGVLATARLASH